jgi:hypothetical protein
MARSLRALGRAKRAAALLASGIVAVDESKKGETAEKGKIIKHGVGNEKQKSPCLPVSLFSPSPLPLPPYR